MKGLKRKDQPYLGHSITNGRIRYTSVSQIKLFDPKSEGCPRKWAFQYRFGKKLQRTGAQTRGSDRGEKLEHYLETGQDVLPPDMLPLKKFLPAPGPDLECEWMLGDMVKAIAAREAYIKNPPKTPEEYTAAENAIRYHAGLTVAGIPVEGAADCRHARGTWIDADGNVRPEHASTKVVSIFDLKMVARIYPQMIQSGENKGKMIPAYTLTDAEVCEDTQMLGYARQAIYRRPDTTHVRLTLGYANTTRREATLRQGLISVEQVLSRFARVEDVARKMEQVAGCTKIDDVEPNTLACDSYTHIDPTDPEGKKVLKGCGHKYYCPLTIAQAVPNMLGTYKEPAMSLFDSAPEAAPVITGSSVPPPPVDMAAHAAAVEAEKARIRAEDAARAAVPPPPPVTVALGFCNKCGTPLGPENSSRLPSGEVKHIGCAAGVIAAPPPPPSPMSVNPADQPRAVTMLEAAAPVPPHEIAQIEDPEIKAVVEQHAREHAEKAAREAAAAEQSKVAAGAAVWCSVSATKVVITTEAALARKWVCQCSKSYTMAVLKPLKEGDLLVSVIPKHKPPKKGEANAAAPPPPPEKKISIIDETTVLGSDEEEDEGTNEVEFAPPPPPPAPPAPPVVAAAPPPPPPMMAHVPPAVTPPPPPSEPVKMTAPPTASEVVSAVDGVIGMTKTNGHANGHTYATLPPPPPPTVAEFGRTRAFQAEVVMMINNEKTLKKRVVIAANVKEAIAKIEGVTPGFVEVRAVKLVVGAVIL